MTDQNQYHSAKAWAESQSEKNTNPNQYHSAKAWAESQSGKNLEALSALLANAVRKNLYYSRQKIYLDGLTFDECSFENCSFVTEAGNFNLKNCRIAGSETSFFYQGNALKITKLYELMSSSVLGRSVFPDFLPLRDKDGRFTV